MEAYVEATDSFVEIAGDTHGFPNLYPGLHLLPNYALFFSRTGWGSAGAGTAFNDNRSAFFTFSDPTTGLWTNLAPASFNLAKGMSVMILKPSSPTVRVFVIGRVDSGGNGLTTAKIFDASILSAGSSRTSPIPVPDGAVFVSGGISRVNSPCTLFDPDINSVRAMDELPSIRGYHSVSLPLPSGTVLVAGGDGNLRIEVFSPPYLFRGPRPQIGAAPALVHHGQTLSITSPDAAAITKIVLVRPLAVTHQTDSEQRVIELPFLHDHAQPDRLQLTAPTAASALAGTAGLLSPVRAQRQRRSLRGALDIPALTWVTAGWTASVHTSCHGSSPRPALDEVRNDHRHGHGRAGGCVAPTMLAPAAVHVVAMW